MTIHRVANAEILVRKRQLRADIARTRHDTSVTIAALRDERRRLTSWRTYVRRYPWAALGASFGVGLWIAAARPGRRLPRSLAASMIQWSIGAARSGLLRELSGFWNAARAGKSDMPRPQPTAQPLPPSGQNAG
jgi:hypothetical protein